MRNQYNPKAAGMCDPSRSNAAVWVVAARNDPTPHRQNDNDYANVFGELVTHNANDAYG
jgi:hypothetical protein